MRVNGYGGTCQAFIVGFDTFGKRVHFIAAEALIPGPYFCRGVAT